MSKIKNDKSEQKKAEYIFKVHHFISITSLYLTINLFHGLALWFIYIIQVQIVLCTALAKYIMNLKSQMLIVKLLAIVQRRRVHSNLLIQMNGVQAIFSNWTGRLLK